jgi:hypothetical protein
VGKLYSTLLFVVAALAVAGFVFWRFFYLATITISPAPTTATVTINGTPTADRVFRVPSGSYQFTVAADGYRPQNLTVNVSLGSSVSKKVELVSLPQPEKLLEGNIRSLATSTDGKIIYFEKGNVLYRHELNTPIVAPITPPLNPITSVDWSEDFALALIHYVDGNVDLYDFNRYDLVHQEAKPLGKTIKQTAWIGDGTGFYYVNRTEAGDVAMMRANRAGSDVTRVGELAGFPLPNFSMTIGQTHQLFLANKDLTQTGDIFLFNAHQRLFGQLTQSGASYGPIVSPNRKQIVYNENGELVTATAEGQQKRNLTVRARVGNYRFLNDTTVAALGVNTISFIDTTTGKAESLEVFAPNDNVTGFTALPDGHVLYVYQNQLYRLNPREVKTAASPSPIIIPSPQP